MGRHAESWKLEWRRGIGYVRFTHQKKQHNISTGQRDRAAAFAEAARLYARVVGGQVARPGARSLVLVPLHELCAEWLASLKGVLDVETLKTYEQIYVAKHWLGHYRTLEDMCSEMAREAYRTKRMQHAIADTVQKEVWAQDKFLRWCKKIAKVIGSVPERLEWDKRALGRRTGKQRRKARKLTIEQVIAFLGALPTWFESGPRAKKRRAFPVRARYVLQYETSFRPATLDELLWGDWQGRYIVLRAEADKVRLGRDVPLTHLALATLEKTREEAIARGLPVGASDPIFGKHRSRKTMLRVAKSVGLDGVNPYDLRHGRGTHLADAGASLTGIGHMLGHTQASTTSKYIHTSARAADEALELADKHRISGPFQVRSPLLLPPAASSTAEPLGDRRGSNPRQLEPQSFARDRDRGEIEPFPAVEPGGHDPQDTGGNGPTPLDSRYVPRIQTTPRMQLIAVLRARIVQLEAHYHPDAGGFAAMRSAWAAVYGGRVPEGEMLREVRP